MRFNQFLQAFSTGHGVNAASIGRFVFSSGLIFSIARTPPQAGGPRAPLANSRLHSINSAPLFAAAEVCGCGQRVIGSLFIIDKYKEIE
ncbi:MAG: hypothetical protein JMDDDDMK_03218 [Acidobacteria bacterium]|nr:hypothetical protein [Acidobacteriota bacterium]